MLWTKSIKRGTKVDHHFLLEVKAQTVTAKQSECKCKQRETVRFQERSEIISFANSGQVQAATTFAPIARIPRQSRRYQAVSVRAARLKTTTLSHTAASRQYFHRKWTRRGQSSQARVARDVDDPLTETEHELQHLG